jgi:hypothetical protein
MRTSRQQRSNEAQFGVVGSVLASLALTIVFLQPVCGALLVAKCQCMSFCSIILRLYR